MLNRPATETQVTHGQRLWLYGTCTLVLAYLVLPCLLVIPMSFSGSAYLEFPPRSLSTRWYETFLGSPEWRAAAWVSLRVSALATVIATVFGTAAAYGLFQLPGRLSQTLRAVFMLPMAAPSILMAVGLFFVFARLDLNNSLTGLTLADAMLAIPFVVVSVGNGLASSDPNLERAARSLGAARLRAFLEVTVPQIRISILSGALFAFVTAFDEVVVALFISGGQSATLTRRMFTSIRDELDPTVAAISSILVILSIVVLVGVQLLQPRRKP